MDVSQDIAIADSAVRLVDPALAAKLLDETSGAAGLAHAGETVGGREAAQIGAVCATRDMPQIGAAAGAGDLAKITGAARSRALVQLGGAPEPQTLTQVGGTTKYPGLAAMGGAGGKPLAAPPLAPADARAVEGTNLYQLVQHTAMTERRLSAYVSSMHIPPNELDTTGSIVLDLGSGSRQGLAREAAAAGLRTKVVSLDPRMALPAQTDLSLTVNNMQERLLGRANPQPYTVAALGSALPFADNSFNAVYASWSLPYYSRTADDALSSIREMLRVTKPGGVVRAVPVPSRFDSIIDGLTDISTPRLTRVEHGGGYLLRAYKL